jgi:hypothetical protein
MRREMAFALRTAVELARHPGAVTTLGWVFQPNKTTWEAGEPWWNPRAIRYLRQNMPRGGKVFEWGSGSSTIWFSRLGLRVTAVEHDADWAAKVSQCCPDADIRLIHAATSGLVTERPGDRNASYFDNYVAAIESADRDSLDVVVVDGECRVECARRAASRVKPGGIVVIDDTNFAHLTGITEHFEGWPAVRLSGFKRRCPYVMETSFFQRPQ